MKITNGFNTLTISAKKLHHRCSTDSECASNWRCCQCGVWVDRRLVYSNVAEARSNHKEFYLCWSRNPACGYSTGSNWIEKDRVGVPPRLVWGNGWEGVVWFNMRKAPFDDWAMLMVVLLMSFFLMASLILVLWGFKDKIMLHCSREVKYQQSYTPGIWY